MLTIFSAFSSVQPKVFSLEKLFHLYLWATLGYSNVL